MDPCRMVILLLLRLLFVAVIGHRLSMLSVIAIEMRWYISHFEECNRHRKNSFLLHVELSTVLSKLLRIKHSIHFSSTTKFCASCLAHKSSPAFPKFLEPLPWTQNHELHNSRAPMNLNIRDGVWLCLGVSYACFYLLGSLLKSAVTCNTRYRRR